MDNTLSVLTELLLPTMLASFAETESEKEMILKVDELCKKHNVPFRSFINISTDFTKWEASRKNV